VLFSKKILEKRFGMFCTICTILYLWRYERKILECEIEKLIPALIRAGIKAEMPSIHDNWRFNFNRHFVLPHAKAFVLITEENNGQIEGCLIFQMKDKVIPSMAFIEVAPHNRG
jgi:hypothetical protein